MKNLFTKKPIFTLLSVLSLVALSFLVTPKHTFAVTAVDKNSAAESLTVTKNPDTKLPMIQFFWSETCPHCSDEIEFLAELKTRYSGLVIESYEVTTNTENADLFTKKAKEVGLKNLGVPLTIIGDKYVSGFGSAETSGKKIEQLLLNQKQSNATEGSEAVTMVNSPFWGDINISNFSLPVLSAVLGLIDGFNPCAMWVLLFLISVLLEIDNPRRRWLLGLTFIFVSGAIYFLFMTAWLNFFLVVGFVPVIRLIVAAFGVTFGTYSIYKFLTETDSGCIAEASESRRNLFSKIKSFVGKESLVLSLLGIGFLAISVNGLELVCSAGIPAIFTQTLVLSNLSAVGYYLYILLYIFFFILDDLIVFLIAMLTLQMVGISTKYTKYAKFIGGVIILLLGIIMVVDPGLLSFN